MMEPSGKKKVGKGPTFMKILKSSMAEKKEKRCMVYQQENCVDAEHIYFSNLIALLSNFLQKRTANTECEDVMNGSGLS